MLEERDAIEKDLDRLERWAHENSVKFSKAQCKVLPLGGQKSQTQYRLDRKRIKSSLEEKDINWLVRSST